MKMPITSDLGGSGLSVHENPGLPSRAPAMPALRARTFLLADDSKNDTSLMQRAFREAGIANSLYVVPDGEEVVDYLSGVGAYANRVEHPMPNVVLLDRNLPRKDGFGVLGWIRTQSALRSMVVIILTTSNRSADADMAHDLGANYYLTKPGRFEELVSLTRCLDDWLKLDAVGKPASG